MKTKEEIREIRGDVAARYPGIDFPEVVLEPLWFGRRPDVKIEGRFAIVNQKTNDVFNVCTDLYQPISHEEIIFLTEQAAANHPEYGKPVMSVDLFADGGKLKVQAKFPDVRYNIGSNVDDYVNPTIDVFSSYDLGWKYGGRFGAYRLVCSNGLTVGKIFESFKRRHLTSLDPAELSKSIGSGMTLFSEQTELWKNWAQEKISQKQYDMLWEELPFSLPEKTKIEALPEAGSRIILPEALKSNSLTRWNFFSVVTQYATHEIKGETRRIEIQPVITKAFEQQF
jgi:hypothetical protein